MTSKICFNTQHSPIGAFARFTLGSKGANGGLALELGKPADQNVFIGIADEKGINCLPFFQETATDSANFAAAPCDHHAAGHPNRTPTKPPYWQMPVSSESGSYCRYGPSHFSTSATDMPLRLA